MWTALYTIEHMKKELREKAVYMRVTQHMSYSAIAKELHVPKSTLSYWLRDYPLSEGQVLELRRKGWSKGEASRERYRNTMRTKKLALEQDEYYRWMSHFATLSKRELLIAGLMLHVGEGGKRNDSQVSLANTDPAVILLFLQWLAICFGIPKAKVKIQLHLYEGMDIEKECKFWHNTLGIKREQFYKPSVRPIRPHSFTYSATHRHGTCSAYVFGIEHKRAISMAMKALLDQIHTQNALRD